MNKDNLLQRIILDPNIMTGKPIIKGTRLTVQFVLNLLAQGETEDNIILEYNGLTKDDIHACLLYASTILDDTTFMPNVEAM
jgi:uncharacterized protein (DUF433 family)